MKYLLSAALMYLAVVVFGAGGWLVSLIIGPGADGILIPVAVLTGVALSSGAALVTQGDIWALFDPTIRPPARGGPEADYDEDP